MDFYVNLNGGAVTLRLTDRQHLGAVQEVTGGQMQPVRIQFHRDQTPELPPDGSVPTFMVKAAGDFGGDALVVANESDFTVPVAADGFYVAEEVSFDTTAIREALEVDGTEGNDVDAIIGCIGEIEWRPTGATKPTKSKRVPFQINNWVIQGEELAEEAALDLEDRVSALEDSSLQVLTGITGLTGGGTANLDGAVTTVGVAVGKLYMFSDPTPGTPVAAIYQLVAGTTAEASPGIIRPDDYNGTTNAKILKRIL